MVDKKKAFMDSVEMINILLNQKKDSTFTLDPVETNLIIEFNKKHLELEKSKVDLTSEEISLVESKIESANKFIQDNPIKEGGGGTKPISPSIKVFQDCMNGFIFALDFSPEEPLLNIGEVYLVTSDGYKGCCQLINNPKKTPPPYLKPSIENKFENCSICLSKL